MSVLTRSHVRVALLSLVLSGLIAALVADPSAQQASRPEGSISGVVQSSQGPEAGVWVIAETNDLPTQFVKIVVTNDDGRFLVPELPAATYDVWVRGYGLVDSTPIEASPGATLTLNASLASTPREAAKVYPANYWYSLLEVPDKSEFPGTGPEGNGIATNMQSQSQWIDLMKQGCQLCHQLGTELTRGITHMQSMDFDSTIAAWDHRVQTGIRGSQMTGMMSRFGRERGLQMYADWTDRIATGEVPSAPPRPSGRERNVVVTLWDWGNESSYVHDEITTDKRNPQVNAGGPVYGVDGGHGALIEVNPGTNSARMITIPVRDNPDNPARSRFATEFPEPSLFWGDEALWTAPADPHNPMMDGEGRVWMTSKVRGSIAPAWCQEGASNKFAQYFPNTRSNRQASYYDPRTDSFALIDTCFGTHHLQFDDDDSNTLYFSGGGQVVGWIDTKLYDETGDDERSQGWCPLVLDTNGDGTITKPWNEPVGRSRSVDEGAGGGQSVNLDLTIDTRVNVGSYGIIASPIDDAVWGSGTQFPGRIWRLDRGSNPPETCVTEMYEVPLINGEYEGFSGRGIDVDRNGVIWTALSGTSHLASFDRSQCNVFNGPQVADGQQCQAGWTLYQVPGPNMKGTDVRADFHYYSWVDQFNTLGLGENVPISNGSGSDSLQVLLPDTGEWVFLRVPYPLGFYSRGLDGRIDDPNAGWKGRGLWANYGTNFVWQTEGGKGTTSKMVHFQIRPDPLTP
jgi:hypothetical protein